MCAPKRKRKNKKKKKGRVEEIRVSTNWKEKQLIIVPRYIGGEEKKRK